MAPAGCAASMPVMRYPKVSEQPSRLVAVEHDPFIDNLPDRRAPREPARVVKPVHRAGRPWRPGPVPRRI